jgi:hypothetical protein
MVKRRKRVWASGFGNRGGFEACLKTAINTLLVVLYEESQTT